MQNHLIFYTYRFALSNTISSIYQIVPPGNFCRNFYRLRQYYHQHSEIMFRRINFQNKLNNCHNKIDTGSTCFHIRRHKVMWYITNIYLPTIFLSMLKIDKCVFTTCDFNYACKNLEEYKKTSINFMLKKRFLHSFSLCSRRTIFYYIILCLQHPHSMELNNWFSLFIYNFKGIR